MNGLGPNSQPYFKTVIEESEVELLYLEECYLSHLSVCGLLSLLSSLLEF